MRYSDRAAQIRRTQVVFNGGVQGGRDRDAADSNPPGRTGDGEQGLHGDGRRQAAFLLLVPHAEQGADQHMADEVVHLLGCADAAADRRGFSPADHAGLSER